jgi:hypothetical protein
MKIFQIFSKLRVIWKSLNFLAKRCARLGSLIDFSVDEKDISILQEIVRHSVRFNLDEEIMNIK